MIMNRPGQTWGYKTWQEQEYPETTDPVESIKVRPREQFVKQMLKEHEQVTGQVQYYPVNQYITYATTHMPSYVSGGLVSAEEVRSGYRGAVRTQYKRIGESK